MTGEEALIMKLLVVALILNVFVPEPENTRLPNVVALVVAPEIACAEALENVVVLVVLRLNVPLLVKLPVMVSVDVVFVDELFNHMLLVAIETIPVARLKPFCCNVPEVMVKS